ncbi:MAG: hypothetical protein HUJ26_20655 [Planctomycetaceae bacterium]|nr:hypothetical protein [Planctomycetaceae bacterium]
MTTTCEKCGSDKIIPEVKMLDSGQYSAGNTKVVIHGNPEAIFFKERFYGELTADICGECGHVELNAANPEELWRAYQKSLEKR